MIDYQGNYAMVGAPGAGKTTFIANQVKTIVEKYSVIQRDAPIALCSLTRTAAKEITSRGLEIPKWRIGTLHAHAFRELGRPAMASERWLEWNEAYPSYSVSPSSSRGDDGAGDEGFSVQATAGDKLGAQVDLLRARCVDFDIWPAAARDFHLKRSEWKRSLGVMDFTDMIEVCEADGVRLQGVELLISDEAQDLSALELRLLRHWGDECGALLLVGDPWQAIYTWRGADPLIFDKAVPDGPRKRHMRVTYRCPRAVYSCAIAWMKRHFSLWRDPWFDPRDAEGLAMLDGLSTWRQPDRLIDRVREDLAEGLSVMVMGSCGYMLEPFIEKCRNHGIPFSNPWRVTRGDWNPLARRNGTTAGDRLRAFLACDCSLEGGGRDWTAAELWAWAEVIQAKGLLRRGSKKVLEQMAADEATRGNVMSFSGLSHLFEPAAVQQLAELVARAGCHGDPFPEPCAPETLALLAWFEASLVESKAKGYRFLAQAVRSYGPAILAEEPRLYVGTIHSFKGAEADSVYIFPDFSPNGAAQWQGLPTQRDDLVRLFYVAMTRARERMTICAPGMRGGAIPIEGLGLRAAK